MFYKVFAKGSFVEDENTFKKGGIVKITVSESNR